MCFLIAFGPYHRTCHFCCFTLALRVLACSLFNLHRLAVLPSFLHRFLKRKTNLKTKHTVLASPSVPFYQPYMILNY